MHAAALVPGRVWHAVSMPLLSQDAGDAPALPPEWVMLVPAGSFSGRDGRGPYTLDAAAVLAAFAHGGIDLPIDYDHQTLEADAKAGPVPAAGWIKALEVRDGALWGRVTWTPRAAELIAAREYRYLSPVFRHDKDGSVLAMDGAGLTHYPNLDLEPVAHTKGDDMTDLTPIAEALGVEAADADVATLAAHAARLKESAQKQPDPLEWVPMAQHRALVDELEVVRREAAAREVAARHVAHAAQVQAHVAAGRIPAGLAETYVDTLDALPEDKARMLIAAMASMPVMAAIGEVSPGAAKTRMSRAEFDALSARERMVAIRAGAEITD